jgi:hypothetical protein
MYCLDSMVMQREVLVISIVSIDNTRVKELVMPIKMTMYLVVYEHSFTLSVPCRHRACVMCLKKKTFRCRVGYIALNPKIQWKRCHAETAC